MKYCPKCGNHLQENGACDSCPAPEKKSYQEQLAELVEKIALQEGTEIPCALRDLLTETMHYAKRMGLDYEQVGTAALEVFEEELEED
jgi:hypothetical protein